MFHPRRFFLGKRCMTIEVRHQFKIGQSVTLSPGFGYVRDARAAYEIVALLPSNGAHFQYRIRCADENFERVAAENEMTPRAH
jgi:hypothetical protein